MDGVTLFWLVMLTIWLLVVIWKLLILHKRFNLLEWRETESHNEMLRRFQQLEDDQIDQD